MNTEVTEILAPVMVKIMQALDDISLAKKEYFRTMEEIQKARKELDLLAIQDYELTNQ